jgi:amino acid adenylation domain-containing protein
VELSADLVGAVSAAARASDATLYMALLATLQALLARYTGEVDVAVGTPIANRDDPASQDLVGYFVNTLVMRADIEAAPTWRALLEQVRRRALTAFEHGGVPFAKVVEAVAPARTTESSPLFQVMLVLEPPALDALDLGPVTAERIDVDGSTARFDLTLVLEPVRGGSLRGHMEYATDLLDRSTVEAMARAFATLLSSAVASPDTPLGRLRLLPEDEQAALLAATDARDTPCPELRLHEMVEAWARRTPQAVAVTFDEKTVTYAELDAQAERLAAAVLASASAPKTVLIAAQDGAVVAAATLAALKAGAAFVCLDLAQPEARLRQIVADLGLGLAIVDRAARAALAGVFEVGSFALVDADSVEAAGAIARTQRPAPRDPAYIAFTSGSTGRPKGVVQSHQAFAQFLAWQARAFAIGEGTRFAVWSPVSYDACYCELFGALAFGGVACFVPAAIKGSPRAMAAWLAESGIDVFQTVPSFAQSLLPALEPSRLGRLRDVLLSGERLPVALARGWLARFGERPRLTNLYGPSETVLATYHSIPAVGEGDAQIPIGRPIDGRQILLLDREGQPCPRGARGDLFVRSAYLTNGYLERPDETRAAYLPNPVTGDPADTVYRTGDVARLREGGVLEFCGRRDGLVKIRGHRVEVGEVAHALERHPGVQECAVLPRTFGPSDDRLVAYVVARAGVVAGDLRTHLAAAVPAFMVPASFVFLEALPRTRTGKLEAARLPAPDIEAVAAGSSGAPPQTALERLVASIWCEVLGVPRVGVEDNFFDLGGHSLLAAQVQDRLERALGRPVPLVDIFRCPTVRDLAVRLSSDATAAPPHADAQARAVKASTQRAARSRLRSLRKD